MKAPKKKILDSILQPEAITETPASSSITSPIKKRRLSEKARKRLCKLFIVFSYLFAYLIPFLGAYFVLSPFFKDSQLTITTRGLAFTGFVVFSILLGLFLFIKVSVKLFTQKVSLFKILYFSLMTLSIVVLTFWLITELRIATVWIAANIDVAFSAIMSVLDGLRWLCIAIGAGIIVSKIFSVAAFYLDKEYCRSLNWL